MFSRKEISSVIYGVAVADALGGPFEFLDPKEIHSRGEIEMTGGKNGLYFLRPGEWTDDTELTLLLAETISHGLPIDWNLLAESYISWAEGDPKDIGTTTATALKGSGGLEESRERARDFHIRSGRGAGNGTIMRCAPMSLLPKLNRKDIRTEAQITHYAPEAWEASFVYVTLLRNILQGKEPLPPQGSWSPKIREALERHRDRDFVASTVAAGGSAWSSLASALWALSFDTFHEGVRAVISLGFDTDTNAACAGGLLAARDGLESIPLSWIKKLEKRDRIESAIDGLTAIQHS